MGTTSSKKGGRAKKQEIPYGLTITGAVRIFASDFEIRGKDKKKMTITRYSITVSEKDDEFESGWFNKYIPVIFGRDDEKPETNTVIWVNQAHFMVVGKKTDKGDYRQVGLFVSDWDYVESED